MSTETTQILEELKAIRTELDYIKDNMPDKDMFFTLEEKKLLDESYKNEKEDRLISNKALRERLR